jgi:light-regulated signal transduction histidine kinase (bacteriophytochrome)
MTKLQRPPMPKAEKEKLSEKFVNAAAKSNHNKPQYIYFRISHELQNDLEKIHNLTGFKKNAFCLYAITQAVREKLKSIEKEDSTHD